MCLQTNDNKQNQLRLIISSRCHHNKMYNYCRVLGLVNHMERFQRLFSIVSRLVKAHNVMGGSTEADKAFNDIKCSITQELIL